MAESKSLMEAFIRRISEEMGISPEEARGLDITPETFERQKRVMYAHSRDSLLKGVNVEHISAAKAKELFSENERKARVEDQGNRWDLNESTMNFGTDTNNRSIEATINNLSRRYIHPLKLNSKGLINTFFEQQYKAMKEFLDDKPVALRSIKHYWINVSDSQLMLVNWWLAANDVDPEILKFSTKEVRLERFVYALEDTLRNGNRNNAGKDDGYARDIKPSCGTGFANKFCEAFFGLHPDNVFVGKIRPVMADLTQKTTFQVYLKLSTGDRKELYEALKSKTLKDGQKEKIESFLSDVHGALTENVKKAFGNNVSLFLPLVDEYAPAAEHYELPLPETIEQNTKKVEQLKNMIEELSREYHCVIDATLPNDPVRISNHPAGEVPAAYHMYKRQSISQLKKCPVSSVDLDFNKSPLLSCRKELVFYAVLALEWINKMPKALFEIAASSKDFNFNDELKEITEVLQAKANEEQVKAAREVLKKLKAKGEISAQEMNPWDVQHLKLLWSFDYALENSDKNEGLEHDVKKQAELESDEDENEAKTGAEFKRDAELVNRADLEDQYDQYNQYANLGNAAQEQQQSQPRDLEHENNRKQREERAREEEQARERKTQQEAIAAQERIEQEFRRIQEEQLRQQREKERKERGEQLLVERLRIEQERRYNLELRRTEAERQQKARAEELRLAQEAEAKRAADAAAAAAAAQAAAQATLRGNATRTRRV